MISAALKFTQAVLAALPVKLAKLMLFGSFILYGWVIWRLAEVEQVHYAFAAKDKELAIVDQGLALAVENHSIQDANLLREVNELTQEVRGYREDMRDELKELKRLRLQQLQLRRLQNP